MRILIIRRDNIGDLVCTTPLFAGLRRRYPEAHIAALVNSYNAAVLGGNPNVDAVHVYTKLKHREAGESRLRILVSRLGMLRRLRQEPYDYIILAKSSFDRHGLRLARQLRRRHVVGFPPPDRRPPDALTIPILGPRDLAAHEVEVMQQIGAALDVQDATGPLQVYPEPARVQAWRERLTGLAEAGRLWIAVHISAREASRRWSATRWIEVIERLKAICNASIVLLWAPGPADDPRHPGDDEKAAAILEQTNAFPAPTLQLADLIAVLSLCRGFIGPDGGAMHLAAALRLPMIAIFEDLPLKKCHWHPWRVPHELMSPDITPERLVRAWNQLAQQHILV